MHLTPLGTGPPIG